MRPERDLRDMVEEVLALVRDLNRAGKSDRNERLSLGSLRSRNEKIVDMIQHLDGGSVTIYVKSAEGGTQFTVRRKSDDGSAGYGFLVPNEVSDAQLDDFVLEMVLNGRSVPGEETAVP